MTGERINDLHADRAVWGLNEHDETELATTLPKLGRHYDLSWERAAAIASLCLLEEVEPAPQHLIDKLESDAEGFWAAHRASTSDRPATPRPGPRLVDTPLPPNTSNTGWYVAAAAILIAAWLGWSQLPRTIDPVTQRNSLLASRDVMRLDWQSGPSDRSGDPSGDVVWSPGEQRGFMRFRGLPANDPEQFQYQLWIFDGERGAPEPVDGGVFDIADDGVDTLVAIDPALRVGNAVTFAVTIEPPGGVVVSKQEHIVTLAKP